MHQVTRLNKELELALEDERYEDAAVLRDRIKLIQTKDVKGYRYTFTDADNEMPITYKPGLSGKYLVEGGFKIDPPVYDRHEIIHEERDRLKKQIDNLLRAKINTIEGYDVPDREMSTYGLRIIDHRNMRDEYHWRTKCILVVDYSVWPGRIVE